MTLYAMVLYSTKYSRQKLIVMPYDHVWTMILYIVIIMPIHSVGSNYDNTLS